MDNLSGEKKMNYDKIGDCYILTIYFPEYNSRTNGISKIQNVAFDKTIVNEAQFDVVYEFLKMNDFEYQESLPIPCFIRKEDGAYCFYEPDDLRK